MKIPSTNIEIIKSAFALVITGFIFSCAGDKRQEKTEQKDTVQVDQRPELALTYDYIGKAVEKASTHVWGSSPVKGRDGRIHLYVAEWPMSDDPDKGFSGWYKHCQIAHYVGDAPEGPFEFLRIAVPDKDGRYNSPHNPTIQYIDNKYILNYIVNENDNKENQRIMMMVADNLDDDWRPASGGAPDGTILSAPADPSYWNHTSDRGTANPSLMKFHDAYYLYFRSVIPDSVETEGRRKRHFGYGVAISDELEGPYEIYNKRVTAPNIQLEDAYAFAFEDQVYLLSRDFRGTFGSNGGGLLWTSGDGLHFSDKKVIRAFDDLEKYAGKEALSNHVIYRGSPAGDLERPQLLIENGIPTYLYVATGINNKSTHGSCSHVFKVPVK